eukprot:g4382.t1
MGDVAWKKTSNGVPVLSCIPEIHLKALEVLGAPRKEAVLQVCLPEVLQAGERCPKGDDACAHRRQSAGHPGPSPAFLAVVEQLVQQHQVELTLAKTQSRKMKSFDLPAANTQDMERLVSCSSNAYGSYGRKSEAPGVMCERNHDLKELNASLLLEAFDEKALIEEEQEERKKEWRTDSTDLIHRFLRPWKRSTPPRRAFVFYTSLFHLKNDGRPGDRLSYAKTNASFATFDWDEMEKETWFTRCQIFLQSTRYEFLIAAAARLAMRSVPKISQGLLPPAVQGFGVRNHLLAGNTWIQGVSVDG